MQSKLIAIVVVIFAGGALNKYLIRGLWKGTIKPR